MSNHFFKKENGSVPRHILICIGVVLGLWICGCAVTAGLISAELIPMEACAYGTLITLFISAFVATKILLGMNGFNRVLIGAGSATVVMLLLLMGNFFLNADGLAGFLPTLVVAIGSSLCALLIKGKKGRKTYQNNIRKSASCTKITRR